jgi:hypothetical protein
MSASIAGVGGDLDSNRLSVGKVIREHCHLISRDAAVGIVQTLGQTEF